MTTVEWWLWGVLIFMSVAWFVEARLARNRERDNAILIDKLGAELAEERKRLDALLAHLHVRAEYVPSTFTVDPVPRFVDLEPAPKCYSERFAGDTGDVSVGPEPKRRRKRNVDITKMPS